MNAYTYKTSGVCSREIYFELDENNRLHNVRFTGGCAGNLLAIGKLVEGEDAQRIIALLAGNDCGGKGTSCADQLARALTKALTERKNGAQAAQAIQ